MTNTPITPDDEGSLPETEAAEALEAAAPIVSVKRRRVLRLNVLPLLLVLVLIAAAALFFGLSRDAVPADILAWWPSPVVIIGAFWLLGSLFRGRSTGLLGASGTIGIGISLLLATSAQVPLGATLVGITLITLGMGIVLRGLLFRPTALNN